MKPYEPYFSRFGAIRDEAEIRITAYLLRPETLSDLSRIAWNDQRASDLIDQCRDIISAMEAYRADLARRYGEIAAAPRQRFVRLEREKRYRGNVIYTLSIGSRLLDGTGEQADRTTYPGTQRNKAIADYRAALKQYPGICAELLIEKSPWEK